MGKYILGILSVAALGWIGYVGINLTVLGTEISPQTVFGKLDPEIVIVHKPLETDYQEPVFHFLMETDLYANILTHTERIQHFYFAPKRQLVLLERSKPWTMELADRYFHSLALSADITAARSFKLSNGWYAHYDQEFLLLSAKEEVNYGENEVIPWKYADRKSTATVVTWQHGQAVLENAYRNTPEEIRYIAQRTQTGTHLADDQDLFQDVIPADFDELTFYQKDYLKTASSGESKLFEWIASGIMAVRKKDAYCFITDCIPGQDPIAILGDHIDESSVNEQKTQGFVQQVTLPTILTPAGDWYVEVFNNRVFIAEDKSVIDQVIGAYETGATLSQNEPLRYQLFSHTPKRVSFRHIDQSEIRTISLLSGSRHTVVRRLNAAEIKESDTVSTPETVQPLSNTRIEGGVAALFPVQGSNFLYVLSASNLLYGINGNEERWKMELQGNVIGKPILSPSGNALVITTTESIYQISRNGNDLNGNAISLSAIPVAPAYPFTWKGKDQLAVVSGKQLIILQSNGTRKSAITLPFQPTETGCIVWANGSELQAIVAGETKGAVFSVDRKRKIRDFALPESGMQLLKTGNSVCFYGISGGQFVRIDHKGVQTSAGSGLSELLAADFTGIGVRFTAKGKKTVQVFSQDGTLLQSIQPGFQDLSAAGCQTLANGKTVVGILDGIANKNYIYNMNGKPFTTIVFDGGGPLKLHRLQNGKLVLIAQSNNYLVRYPIDN